MLTKPYKQMSLGCAGCRQLVTACLDLICALREQEAVPGLLCTLRRLMIHVLTAVSYRTGSTAGSARAC